MFFSVGPLPSYLLVFAEREKRYTGEGRGISLNKNASFQRKKGTYSGKRRVS